MRSMRTCIWVVGGWRQKESICVNTRSNCNGANKWDCEKEPYESIAEATAMRQTDGIVRQSQCESILEATAMGQASGIMSHEMGPKGCEVVGSLLR